MSVSSLVLFALCLKIVIDFAFCRALLRLICAFNLALIFAFAFCADIVAKISEKFVSKTSLSEKMSAGFEK